MVSGILSLNDKGNAPDSASEAPTASVAPVWLGPARGVGARGGQVRRGRRRSLPCSARSPDPRARRGTGAAPEYPGGAGKARGTGYF